MSRGGARLRGTLLDATRGLLRERQWRQVTMSDVARAAGVSRQTVYNEFGSRQALAQALVLREADEFLTGVEQALRDSSHDGVAALRAALARFLESAASDPVVRAVVAGGEGDLLELVTTRGGPVVEYGAQRLAAVIGDIWPQAPRGDVGALADCLVRLGISHAALPGGPPELVAAELSAVLGPFIQQAVAEA